MSRPHGAPSASSSGKVFDEDLWNRMHYNMVKQTGQSNLAGGVNTAPSGNDREGTPFEKMDVRCTTVNYAGRSAHGVARERTMRDVKKDITGRLRKKREGRLKSQEGFPTVEVGGGAGGCAVM